jgi:hypothetical protein
MKPLGALLLTGSLLVGLGSSASPALASNRFVVGTASTYGPGYNGFLALPEGKGIRVRICSTASGIKRCLIRVSNDAGPSKAMQRRGRVADLDVPTFDFLCKCSWRTKGLIHVTVEYLGQKVTIRPRPVVQTRPKPTLPPTDTGPVIRQLYSPRTMRVWL